MSGQPSVYVSSTFEDLKSARARVLKAISAQEATALAMENYGARDQAALEKCIADVEKSHVYVGLVGWVYGSTPPGSSISYTEHEFEAAGRVGIPRLMYFLPEGKRPAGLRDDDPIIGYRARASQGRIRKAFEDETELVTFVATDLGRELARLRSRSLPEQRLLPYLCDREPQTSGIAAEVAEQEDGNPAVCVLYGAGNQSPLKFLDCLKHVHLPEYLATAEGSVREFILEWPHAAVTDVGRGVQLSLARELGLDVRTTSSKLEGLVRERVAVLDPGPVLVTLHAPAENLGATEVEQLRRVVRYFKDWPSRSPRKPDLIVICFAYGPPKPSLLERIGLGGRNKALAGLRGAVAQLAELDGIRVLPELTSVRHVDAAAWTRREELDLLVGERDLEQDVLRIFKTVDSLPMAELAPKLLELLVGAPKR